MGNKDLSSNYTLSRELARDIVLRKCGQTEPLPFSDCYPDSILSQCRKIGDGSFGEVYLLPDQDGGETVLKVMPIEGKANIMDQPQKKFHEVLTEIVSAMELSNLRYNTKNSTTSFNEVKQVRCIKGCYPDSLIKFWSRNPFLNKRRLNLPPLYSSEQLYIVLELANAGRNLANCMFHNAAQAYSIFKQITCALAIAESELKFEHRDLHFGNIMITRVEKNKTLTFLLDEKPITIETNGVEVSIIDFTLSRIMFEDTVLFHDLSKNPYLHVAKNCVYRYMMRRNGNNWQDFEPYTNLQWLRYISEKLLMGARPLLLDTKQNNCNYQKLERLNYEVLQYTSAQHFVKRKFMSKKFSLSTSCCVVC